VIFDLAPPLRMNPADARNPRILEDWFATWRSPIETNAQDLHVAVGGDVAYAFGLQRMIGVKTDGEEVDMWFRATACFVRGGDGWRITHMHNSVPFAMDGSNRALLDLQPN
jgi:ketosteroid isomerase-like protein